jgi:methionyl-tRNA formyltransferase
MRVAIVGQKSFGAAVLERLSSIVEVAWVHVPTTPQEDKLGALAREMQIASVYEVGVGPASQVDLIINAHGHDKIPARVIEATTHGAIGYHPSLLPRHRGRSAIEWTIEMRDPIAGGTVYQLTDGYDTGPLLSTAWCHVDPEWDASTLWRERLFPMGVDLLDSVVRVIAAQEGITWGQEQDDTFATYEPVWGTEAGEEHLGWVRQARARADIDRLNELEQGNRELDWRPWVLVRTVTP